MAAGASDVDPRTEIITRATLLTVSKQAGQESLDIAPAYARAKALTVRAEHHGKLTDELEEASAGIEQMLHNSRRSKETLKSLELKLQRLRLQLKPGDADRYEVGSAMAKKDELSFSEEGKAIAPRRRAMDIVADEIAKARGLGEELYQCPHCGRTLLAATSMTHAVECERRVANNAAVAGGGMGAVRRYVARGDGLSTRSSRSPSPNRSPEHSVIEMGSAGSAGRGGAGVYASGRVSPGGHPMHGFGALTGSPRHDGAAGGTAAARRSPTRTGGSSTAHSIEHMGSSTSGPRTTTGTGTGRTGTHTHTHGAAAGLEADVVDTVIVVDDAPSGAGAGGAGAGAGSPPSLASSPARAGAAGAGGSPGSSPRRGGRRFSVLRRAVVEGDEAGSDDSDDDGHSDATDSDLEDQVVVGGAGSGRRHKSVRTARFRSSRTADTAPLAECPSCRRRYPAKRFEKHVRACRQKQLLATAVSALGDELEHAFVPQPPTNLRVLSVTHCTISLAWTPPIFDGGALITAYEVEFTRRYFASKSRVNPEFVEEKMPLASTLDPTSLVLTDDGPAPFGATGASAAALVSGRADSADDAAADGALGPVGGPKTLRPAKPGQLVVAPRGITLPDLLPNNEYRHFRVRAVNRAGPSLWSNEIFSVRTKPPKAPTEPRRVRVDERGQTWFQLRWEPPESTGGGTLSGYEIMYAEARPKFTGKLEGKEGDDGGGGGKVEGAGGVSAAVGLPTIIKIPAVPGPLCSWRIEELRGGTRYIDITVTAINESGLRGPPSAPAVVTETQKMSREAEILQDLALHTEAAAADAADAQARLVARAAASGGRLPAPDPAQLAAMADKEVEVVYQKVFQRMPRSRYIELLERELAMIRKIKGRSGDDDDGGRHHDGGHGEGKEGDHHGSPSMRRPGSGMTRAGDASGGAGAGAPSLLMSGPDSPDSPGSPSNPSSAGAALPGAVPSPTGASARGGAASPTGAGAGAGAGSSEPASSSSSTAIVPKANQEKASALTQLMRQRRGDMAAERQRELAVRRSHFTRRIELLTKKGRVLESDYYNVARHRERLMRMLADADRRRRMLAAEWEVVRDFGGVRIDSSVMHGRRQIFDARELRYLISTELSQLDASCATLRGLVVETLGQVAKAQAAVTENEDVIKERRAALAAFNHAAEREARLVKLVARIGVDFIGRCFNAWRAYVEGNRRTKRNLVRYILRWLHGSEARAFNTWKEAVRYMRVAEAARKKEVADVKMQVSGLGSLVLAEAESLRMTLAKDTDAAMAVVQAVGRELQAGGASLGQRKLATQFVGAAALTAVHNLPGLPFDIASPLQEDLLELITAPTSDPLLVGKSGGLLLTDGSAGAGAGAGMLLEDEEGEPSIATGGSKSGGSLLVSGPRPAGAGTPGGLTAAGQIGMMDSLIMSATGADLGAAGTGGAAVVPGPGTLAGRPPTMALSLVKKRRNGAGGGVVGLEREIAALRYTFRGADPVAVYLVSQLRQATVYVDQGAYVAALPLLRRCELTFGYFKDGPGLLATYRLICSILDRLNRMDLAFVYWDRCARIAEEVGHELALAEAKEGVGRALGERGDMEGCLSCFQRAEEVYERRGDRFACARVYRHMVKPLRALHRNTEADQMDARATEIENHGSMALAAARSRLLALHDRLVADSAKATRLLKLEAVGLLVPLLRNQEVDTTKELRVMEEMQAKLKGDIAKQAAKVAEFKAELVRVEPLPALLEIESSVFSRAPRKYVVEGLREQCVREIENVSIVIANLSERSALVGTRQRNAEAALEDIRLHLKAETSDLIKRSVEGLRFRDVAPNPVNIKVNDALGISVGGFNRIISAGETAIYLHSTADGRCVRALTSVHAGGPRTRDTIGHTKVITSLACYGTRIYSGAADGSVAAWDAVSRPRYDGRDEFESPFEWEPRDLKGPGAAHLITDDPDGKRKARARAAGSVWASVLHTSSVVALGASAFFVVSGGSDSVMMVSDAATGTSLRRLRAHESGVSCLSVHDKTFASGGPDRLVYLWLVDFEPEDVRGTLSVTQGWRMDGHSGGVTSLYCLGNDVCSGDSKGQVILWNGADGTALVKHQVHKQGSAVYLVQNDAMKVVSYGADHRLVVTDVIQGTMMQETREPHGPARVIALQFDTDTLVTVAEDRTMRVWAWKAGRFSARPREIAERPAEHIVLPEQQLQDIGETYGLTVADILAFNGMRDAHKIYAGMRLALYPPLDDAVSAAGGRRKEPAFGGDSAAPAAGADAGAGEKGSGKPKARPGFHMFNAPDEDEEEEGGDSTARSASDPFAKGKAVSPIRAKRAASPRHGAGAGAGAGASPPMPKSVHSGAPTGVPTRHGDVAPGESLAELALSGYRSIEDMAAAASGRQRGTRLGSDAVEPKLTVPAVSMGGSVVSAPPPPDEDDEDDDDYGAGAGAGAGAAGSPRRHAPSPGRGSKGRAGAASSARGKAAGAGAGAGAGEARMPRAAEPPKGRIFAAASALAPRSTGGGTAADTLRGTVGMVRAFQMRGGPEANYNSLKRKVLSMKMAAAASTGIASVGPSGRRGSGTALAAAIAAGEGGGHGGRGGGEADFADDGDF